LPIALFIAGDAEALSMLKGSINTLLAAELASVEKQLAAAKATTVPMLRQLTLVGPASTSLRLIQIARGTLRSLCFVGDQLVSEVALRVLTTLRTLGTHDNLSPEVA
jgi:hypothetical protein